MGFLKRVVRGRTYQVFAPRSRGPVPLVVFLNGVGENGTDGDRQMRVGLPAYVRAHEATFPAAAVFVQCSGPWKFVGDDERMVLDAVEVESRALGVDPARVYLTGISQGGCSTFDLGAKHPERWAGLVPVCGAGYRQDAPRIKGPIWIFHGECDPAVPPSGPNGWDKKNIGGRDMAKLIPHARYTEFPHGDHFIWDRVYGYPAMWEWLFAQHP